MLSIEILLGDLHEHMILNRCQKEDFSGIQGVLFFDPDSCPSLESKYLYVCSVSQMTSIQNLYTDDVFLFCTASPADTDLNNSSFLWCQKLVILDLPVHQLANCLTMSLNEYSSWLSALHLSDDIQKITETAVRKFHAPAAVLNSFFFPNAIYYETPPQSEAFQTLASNRRIPSNQAAPILSVERDNSHSSSILFYDGEIEITDYPIRYNNRVIARIFIETSSCSFPSAKYYLEDYINTVRPYLETRDSLKKTSMNATSTLISDLINSVLTDPEQIEEYRKIIPDLVCGEYYCPVVITFTHPGREIPYNYISGQLEMIFPRCSVATYNSGLVVIVPKTGFTEQIRFDSKHLTELLMNFDAYAGIGNSTHFLTALRPLYIEAAATTRLGQVFCKDRDTRIFFYEDYCMYFYVDLCMEAVVRQHSVSNITYLCDPGLIQILHYDRQNTTCLFETLQTYIESNCNATLCAQKMYSHRNTINYRIKLIEDILGASLHDASLVQKMSFSIRVVEYEKQYLKCDPLEQSGKLSLNKEWDSYFSITEKPYY